MSRRPLGKRAYSSIPHLPGSRTGPSDRTLSPGQARLCVERCRDRDEVIVQEKLDGSCVAAARIGDEIVALGREGRLAADSPNPGRQLWARWVEAHRARFAALLRPGEHAVGEWLALAHATRYRLEHEPFVCFDIIGDGRRIGWDALVARLAPEGFVSPGLVHRGAPLPVDDAMDRLGGGFHGAIDPVEGAVWRVERRDGPVARVVVVAKFVRPGKVDGHLLPENSGRPAIWNWRPDES